MSEELKEIEARDAHIHDSNRHTVSIAAKDRRTLLRLLREAQARVKYLEADIGPQVAEYLAGDARLIHKNSALEAENVRLRGALRLIANADRSYPDKRIADDMQYCARAALSLKQGDTPPQRGPDHG